MGARPMLATIFAANALSVSVPLAGPELGTAFTFRRYTGLGADAPLAAWSLLVGGVASAAAGAVLITSRPRWLPRLAPRSLARLWPRWSLPPAGRGCAVRWSGPPPGCCGTGRGCCAGPPRSRFR